MFNILTVIDALLAKAKSPITGYDITKRISAFTGNSHQQIYRELNKLHLAKKIKKVHIPQQGSPDKSACSLLEKYTPPSFDNIPTTDFRKQKISYALLTHDILHDTQHFDEYIKTMKDAEDKFLASVSLK